MMFFMTSENGSPDWDRSRRSETDENIANWVVLTGCMLSEAGTFVKYIDSRSNDAERDDLAPQVSFNADRLEFYRNLYESFYDPASPYSLDILRDETAPPERPRTAEGIDENASFNNLFLTFQNDLSVTDLVLAVKSGAPEQTIYEILVRGENSAEARYEASAQELESIPDGPNYLLWGGGLLLSTVAIRSLILRTMPKMRHSAHNWRNKRLVQREQKKEAERVSAIIAELDWVPDPAVLSTESEIEPSKDDKHTDN